MEVKTVLKLRNENGKYAVSVDATEMNIEDFLDQLVKPLLISAGYAVENVALIRAHDIQKTS
jgi:hypothetical protein